MMFAVILRWLCFLGITATYVRAFPAIPWLTIPSAFINQPIYLAHPPVFATGGAGDQQAAYGGYRLDMFYEPPTTTAAPAAPAAKDLAAASVAGSGSTQASASMGRRRRR
ncbi:hypothetical protein BV898_03294 [Hypsibius exemplaris]|uniref:Secreted protein n=1 Tax=Hypsibius exemplaris TaxID=2072580 RepID=A0A1W0X6B0_HYPEX|nr:hypothetical protein BV898_03294 [Hypsibius exemplaris]